MNHRLTGRVTWGPGPVGDAVRASLEGRLRRFVRDEESEPVALFGPGCRAVSDAGEWYGEHLGKWLVAASHAYGRTGDDALGESIRRVVDFLLDQQEADGYLGTYAPDAPCRMTSAEAEGVRTWDVWVHAWTILGLLAAPERVPLGTTEEWKGEPWGRGLDERGNGLEEGSSFPDSSAGVDSSNLADPRHPLPHGSPSRASRGTLSGAAIRIGDLLLETFRDRSPLDQGNHAGLSAGVIVQPLAELTLATGDPRYAALALKVVDEMESRLGLLSKSDVAEIGTGKAYQILWVLVGLVALHRATGEARLLETAKRLWTNVATHHLTPLGGPWGGIEGHKETFAAAGAFSPYGMVETCSAATWMSLSRELFRVTGESKYVAAFERTLMNTLLGALDENGADWVYFTFPNGRRNNTYHWACCKSSGAMALEECADLVASATDDAIWLNLLLPCRVEIEGATIEVTQEGETWTIDYAGDRPLHVRVPEWAEDSTPNLIAPNTRTSFSLKTPLRVVPFTHSVDHHGQEIARADYAYLIRGPFVYATGLIDGFKKEETLRLARLTPEAPFRTHGEAIDFHAPGRDPIPFLPYYRAGGRHDGAWRITWLGIAWQ